MINRILEQMPEFQRDRYRRQVAYGNSCIEDHPTLYFHFREIRDRLLNEKSQEGERETNG